MLIKLKAAFFILQSTKNCVYNIYKSIHLQGILNVTYAITLLQFLFLLLNYNFANKIQVDYAQADRAAWGE